MIISCPSCSTNFAVPDAALGAAGRKLKCAKCGHKWHQMPPGADDPADFDIDALIAATAQPLRDAPDDFRRAPGPADEDGLNFDDIDLGDNPPLADIFASGGSAEDEDAAPATEEDLNDFLNRSPDPIPDVFSSPAAADKPRRGGAGLWALLVLLIWAGIGGGLFYLQDRVVSLWPAAAKVYSSIGIRREVIGAGLMFRNYSSERLVQDNSEVLIVRGIIANTTEKARDVPLLRLALYDGQTVVQEKVVNPPATTLDAGGTVGFRVTLDQPNPAANRFEVTFTAAEPEAPKAAADAAKAEK